jgi:excisionase family DNA binding protein
MQTIAQMQTIGLPPKVAKEVIGCGTTNLYELLNAGELDSYFIGRSRRITTESLRAFVARQTQEAA